MNSFFFSFQRPEPQLDPADFADEFPRPQRSPKDRPLRERDFLSRCQHARRTAISGGSVSDQMENVQSESWISCLVSWGQKSKSYEARFISFFLFPMIKLSRHYIERGKKAGFWSLERQREKKYGDNLASVRLLIPWVIIALSDNFAIRKSWNEVVHPFPEEWQSLSGDMTFKSKNMNFKGMGSFEMKVLNVPNVQGV